MIKVPLNNSLVGYSATYGQLINIIDAHQDPRFNTEVDIKNNYRTKSVLCVPIYS